jgi:hypothetical protein
MTSAKRRPRNEESTMQAKMAMMEVGRVLQKAGPYVVLEVVLPGGTLFALLLYLHRTGQLRKFVAVARACAGSEPRVRARRFALQPAGSSGCARGDGVELADACGVPLAAAQKKKRPRAAAASSLIQRTRGVVLRRTSNRCAAREAAHRKSGFGGTDDVNMMPRPSVGARSDKHPFGCGTTPGKSARCSFRGSQKRAAAL